MNRPTRIQDLLGGEVWEVVAEYDVHRYRKSDDEAQDVTVRVLFSAEFGYSVISRDEERNLTATGNPHRDLDVVLSTVHWRELDRNGELSPVAEVGPPPM